MNHFANIKIPYKLKKMMDDFFKNITHFILSSNVVMIAILNCLRKDSFFDKFMSIIFKCKKQQKSILFCCSKLLLYFTTNLFKKQEKLSIIPTIPGEIPLKFS